MSETFTYIIYINAPAEAVWEALTTASFTRQFWGGRSIESDWQVGSSVRHVKPDGTFDWEGKILQADPPNVLSYSWQTPGLEPSKVTFDLKFHAPNTRLLVTHENLQGDPQRMALLKEGWSAILSSLKTLLERGEALAYPYWKE
ncbi:MAG TPA: SRPBCC family protein [Phototrophicaceae bacterium]|nr:SRPBCC family protein [Phototrophicaceae bacterium]